MVMQWYCRGVIPEMNETPDRGLWAQLKERKVIRAAIAYIIVGWVVWFYRSWTGTRWADSPRKRAFTKWGPIALLAVLVVFGVARNFLPYLGSGVG